MSPSKPKVAIEWVLETVEDFRTKLPLMLAFRKMNQEALGWKMGKGITCRTLFSAFLLGKQADVKMSTFLEACEAMELEVIVRRKTDKPARRLAGLAAEREAARAAESERVRAAKLEAEGRDGDGKLKVLTPEVTAEVDKLLGDYGSFS